MFTAERGFGQSQLTDWLPFEVAEDEVVDAENVPWWLERQGKGLEREGVVIFVNYWADFLANPVGGRSQEAAYTHELVFGATLKLEELIGLPGAALTVSGGQGVGRNLSQDIGNFFTVSQTAIIPTTVFYQLTYTQELWDDRVQFSLGRMNASGYFVTLPAFGMLVTGGLNSSPASMFLNAPFIGSPEAVWAALLETKPTDEVYWRTGIFQASSRAGEPAYHGLDFSIRAEDGFLLISETGWTPQFGKEAGPAPGDAAGKGGAKKEVTVSEFPGYAGAYVLGGYWGHDEFERFDGGFERDTFGFYALAQQMVWRSRSNPNRHFSLWGGATVAPQTEISTMPFMGLAGFVWQGPLPRRDQDLLQLAFMIGSLSPEFAAAQRRAGEGYPTYEAAFDLSYVVQLNENLSIQPDVQLILRPGGRGDIPPAFVIGMQATANF